MDAMSNHEEKQLRILQGPGAETQAEHKHAHDHGDGHEDDEHAEDGILHDRQMDLSAVREKLKE